MNQLRTTAYALPKVHFVVYGLMVSIVGLTVLYMYLLSATVLHVVMRAELEQKVLQSETALSELETELMLAQHKVSADIASLAGYVEPKERIFIERGGDTLVLRERLEP